LRRLHAVNEDMGGELYRAELKVLHLASSSAGVSLGVIVVGIVEGVEGMV